MRSEGRACSRAVEVKRSDSQRRPEVCTRREITRECSWFDFHQHSTAVLGGLRVLRGSSNALPSRCLEGVDVNDGLRERLGSFLRQVVPDATAYQAMLITT